MEIYEDLLAQARMLATIEPTRPKQASLRRAVSAAYYSLFHLLTSEASRGFAADDRLWKLVNRAYGHKQMKEVSERFAKGEWPKAFDKAKGAFQVPRELRNVAQAFIDLQEARHEADYDITGQFTRSGALALVEQAEQALRDWKALRSASDDLARIYLACFLVWDVWNRGR